LIQERKKTLRRKEAEAIKKGLRKSINTYEPIKNV